MEKKIKVAVIGATGAVGQVFMWMLSDHPWFELSYVTASAARVGQEYGKTVHWVMPFEMPESIKTMEVREMSIPQMKESGVKIVFSALPASVAKEAEPMLREAGFYVFSNAAAMRYDSNVPILIPDTNIEQLELIKKQGYPETGFCVTNANCVTTGLAMALAPLRKFGIKTITINSYQSVSGAGYPGLSSFDITDNCIPYIGGEEEKIERELAKIFGTVGEDGITPGDFIVSAACNRVPVRDGHTVCVSFSTRKKAGREELLDAMEHCYPALGLYSSPEKVLEYNPSEDRPQPLMDVNAGKGMTVTAGRLRPCGILDWKMTAFGHNTVRGAAGAAVLNAELIVKQGFLKK